MNIQQLAEILNTRDQDLQDILNCVVRHFNKSELNINIMTDDMVMMIVDMQIRNLLKVCDRLTTLYKMSPETRHTFREALAKLLQDAELERDIEITV